MLQIGDTIISLDLFEKQFCCDLDKCKGVCCVAGDSGAPLEDSETKLIEQAYVKIKSYLRPEAIEAIEKQGTWVIDFEDDKVTPLVNDKECAYVIFENGIALCGIEKAYFDGVIEFRKPVSCHLYPVRVKKFRDFTGVNYDTWDICKPARELGTEMGLPVFQFNKDALVRKFGDDWYMHLKIASEKLKTNK